MVSKLRAGVPEQIEAPPLLPRFARADHFAGGIGSGTLFLIGGICRR
jgi:hypothetical protein